MTTIESSPQVHLMVDQQQFKSCVARFAAGSNWQSCTAVVMLQTVEQLMLYGAYSTDTGSMQRQSRCQPYLQEPNSALLWQNSLSGFASIIVDEALTSYSQTSLVNISTATVDCPEQHTPLGTPVLSMPPLSDREAC